jgi:hypothetical protein
MAHTTYPNGTAKEDISASKEEERHVVDVAAIIAYHSGRVVRCELEEGLVCCSHKDDFSTRLLHQSLARYVSEKLAICLMEFWNLVTEPESAGNFSKSLVKEREV